MKINIDFDDVVYAFEQSNFDRHFLIDTKENEIIHINEEVEVNVDEKLEKMEDERHILISKRTAQDDFKIIETFVYEIGEKDFELAEKFHTVLEGKKPFKNFKALLLEYPDIREKWFKYKDKEMRNQTINCLCENGIELINQKLIPDIEIKELKVYKNEI